MAFLELFTPLRVSLSFTKTASFQNFRLNQSIYLLFLFFQNYFLYFGCFQITAVNKMESMPSWNLHSRLLLLLLLLLSRFSRV